MTTRVQKGGPVFRPVIKSRSRPTAGDDLRQSSAVPDGDGNSVSANSTSVPFASVPPPESAPSSMSNVPHVPRTSSSLQIVNPNVVSSISVHSHASSFAVNYNPAIPSLASNLSSSIRNTHRLSLNQPVSINTSVGPSHSNVPTSSVTDTRPSHVLDQPSGSDSRMALSPSQGYVVRNGIEDLPNSLNAGVVIGPSRTATTMSASNVNTQSNADITTQDSDPNLPKRTTRRKGSQESPAESPKHSRRKRKTAPSSDVEGNDEESGTDVNKPKRRTSSGIPRARKSRPPSLPPFDADADPGEEIDPTVVTMASLCEDTGLGRVSRKAVEILTNHAAWKAQNREKRARMKTLMEQKKYGRDEAGVGIDANPNLSSSGEAESTALLPKPSNPVPSTGHLDDTGGGFDYSQDLATSRFNVQVRIGPNGETIIDEESLVVDRAEAEDTENYTHVVESDNTKFVNSGSYGKRFRGSRWSAEETESFYEALSQYGENYELIAYVLPGRDRKSCKNKFKAEDKKNPARINYCLRNTIPVDMETLSRMTGKDFSGPVPEIRAPTPRTNVEVNNSVADGDESSAPRPAPKKNSNKRKAVDDGVVIIGEVGGVEDQ